MESKYNCGDLQARRECVFLAQSDTTIGFLSQDPKKLNDIKGRNAKQSVIVTLESLEKLKQIVRVPKLHKKRIRQSQRSTFIYRSKNALRYNLWDSSLGIRVVRDSYHRKFLEFFSYLYSTSANLHKKHFDLEFATKKADIWIMDKRGFKEAKPSKIFKVGNFHIGRVR